MGCVLSVDDTLLDRNKLPINRLNRCDDMDFDCSVEDERVSEPANGSVKSGRRDDDAIGIAPLDGESRNVCSGDDTLLARAWPALSILSLGGPSGCAIRGDGAGSADILPCGIDGPRAVSLTYVCTSEADTIPSISSASAGVESIRGLAGLDVIRMGNGTPDVVDFLLPPLVVLLSDADRADPLPEG